MVVRRSLTGACEENCHWTVLKRHACYWCSNEIRACYFSHSGELSFLFRHVINALKTGNIYPDLIRSLLLGHK